MQTLRHLTYLKTLKFSNLRRKKHLRQHHLGKYTKSIGKHDLMHHLTLLNSLGQKSCWVNTLVPKFAYNKMQDFVQSDQHGSRKYTP